MRSELSLVYELDELGFGKVVSMKRGALFQLIPKLLGSVIQRNV